MQPIFFEVYILDSVSFTALDLPTQALWLFKFLQWKSWSSILHARATISDFLKVWFIYLYASRDNIWYVIQHFKKYCSILTCCLPGKWWVMLYKCADNYITTLIAELICGLLEPYLKFKTLLSVYCSNIYLQLTLLKVVCLCYSELCKFLMRHKSNHCLTAAERFCVSNKINTQYSCWTRFSLDSFVHVFQRTIFDIQVNISRSFAQFWPAVCRWSGELNCIKHAYKLNTTRLLELYLNFKSPSSSTTSIVVDSSSLLLL